MQYTRKIVLYNMLKKAFLGMLLIVSQPLGEAIS